MSKIEVDAITQQSGSTLTVGGGASKTVVADATTVTLGRCGGTVALASGASQSGFGRTGTVDWQTGSIKTSTFTAANGEGYFVDTSSGTVTMNLPAGTAGNIVSVVDYTNTFQTNSLTVTPNGSQKIGGIAASFVATTEGQSLTWVYVDDTEGWKNVQDSTSNATANPFIVATGGTITTCGNCKIHTFTGPGTFTVSTAAQCAANNVVSHLVLAGGASGGNGIAGGGGAGGYREVKSPVTPFTASPLDGYPSAPNRVTVTATAFPITVGAGGAVNPSPGNIKGLPGNPSIFSTITSTAGGAGSGYNSSAETGGSGGGGSGGGLAASGAGGNTPPVSPPQGSSGGDGAPGNNRGGGGGGGATTAGSNTTNNGGNGGAGATSSINATPTARGGGGGGGNDGPHISTGGTGGGGTGGHGPSCNAGAGTANTGGGGGGGGPGYKGGAGGSGIVIIRYKFQ